MRWKNYGHNVIYSPKHFYEPKTEQDVLTILERHKKGRVRVQSTGHSWSEIVGADAALVRMTHFSSVAIEQSASGPVARIGAGAILQDILDTLHRTSAYTLPTLGGIKRQTIAGATATATHGTGNTSLSNFIQKVKLACYDQNGEPRVKTISEGDELLAARASLGCMGVILEVTIRIVPKFWMREVSKEHTGIESILQEERSWPQQQFLVFPYGWRWYAYHRKKVEEPDEKAKRAMRWFKRYDFLMVEVGLHSLLKFAQWAAHLLGKRAITGFWANLMPRFMRSHTVAGDSETILTLHTEHHYLFRHVEMELFIPKEHAADAASFMREAIPYFAGQAKNVDAEMTERLKQAGLLSDFEKLRGTYIHHYPLFFRHILPEDTLIAMNQGGEWYSMSIFTFQPPGAQKQYRDFCAFLARALAKLFSARPHWGKYNPLTYTELKPLYPHLDRFRAICEKHDPNGVFQNNYTRLMLGLGFNKVQ
jgi:L-gulonolactone oxidase